MSLQHCYFVVNSGAKPPKEFFEAVVKKFPTAASAAFIKKDESGDGNDSLEIFPAIDKPTVQDFFDLLEEAKNSTAIIWACKTDTLSEGDVQPISVLEDAEGNKHIVVFANGDFTSFAKTDSSLDPSQFAVSEYLARKIVELQEKHETVEATLEALDTPENRQEMLTQLFANGRGCATVLGSAGLPKTFINKNTIGLNAEWGYSTDHCGYGQADAKKPNRFQAAKSSAGTAGAAPAANEAVAAPAAAPAPKAGSVRIRPAKTMIQTNINAKKWYAVALKISEAEVEKQVPNYAFKDTVVEVPESRLAELRKDPIGKFFNVVAAEPEPVKVEVQPVASGGKPKPVSPPPDTGSKISLPVMTNATKESMKKWMDSALSKSILDSSSNRMMTVEDIKAHNQKYADWFRQMSVEDQRIASSAYPYEWYADMAKQTGGSESVAILAFNYSCRAAMAEARVRDLEAKYEPKPVEKPIEVVKEGSEDVSPRKNRFTAAKLKTGTA